MQKAGKTSLISAILLSISMLYAQTPTPRDVDLTAPDGIRLKATYFAANKPGPAILLFHACGGDARKAWDHLATLLATAGFHVLTIDYRGFGESGGERFAQADSRHQSAIWDKWPDDFDIAFNHLLSQSGVDGQHVGAAGASCGGENAVQLALRHPQVRTIVSLSGGVTQPGLEFLLKTDRLPVLFVASEDDVDIVPYTRWLRTFSHDPQSAVVEYKKAGHGTGMFKAEAGLEPRIVNWFVENLRDAPEQSATAPPEKSPLSAEMEFWSVLTGPDGAARGLEAFREARRRNPDAILFPRMAVSMLGSYYLRTGRVQDAVKVLELNVEAYPKSPFVYYSLANAYLETGEKDTALQNYEKALQMLQQDTTVSREVREEGQNRIERKLTELRAPQVRTDAQPDLFVETDWLAAHSADAGVVILQVGRDRSSYDSGHIPNARFLPFSDIAVMKNGLPNQMPAAEQLQAAFEKVGVNNRARIVLYDDSAGLFAARAWFALEYLGVGSQAALLNGSLTKWKSESRTLSTEEPKVTPTLLATRPRQELIVDRQKVQQMLSDPNVILLDARPPDEFSGVKLTAGATRAGHIPGARNVYWLDNLENSQNPVLKPISEIRKRYEQAGVSPGKKVVVYCRAGVQASYDYLTLRMLGYEAVVYDGSFFEWSKAEEVPVETADSPTKPKWFRTWPVLTGEYLGQKKPGRVPELFASGIVSSPDWEHSPLVFSTDGRELYWSVVYDGGKTGLIWESKLENGRWTEPQPASFSERQFRDICPVLSADGRKLYFTSTRPLKDHGAIGDFNIWFVERTSGGWSVPKPFDSIPNSGKDARPAFAQGGTIYFGSWRAGSIGGSNIYRARLIDGKYTDPENLGPPISNANETPTYVAPDESFLIFESFRPGGLGKSDFYFSFLQEDDSWSAPVNLGEPINSPENDWFGGFSPDGKYFFFVSDRDGNNDLYWVDARVIYEQINRRKATGDRPALTAVSAASSGNSSEPFRGMRPYLVAISVEKLDRSIEWYSKALGLRVVKRMGSPSEGIEAAFLECEGFRLELLQLKGSVKPVAGSGNPASVRGIGKFAFQVDDLEDTVGELGKRGVHIANEFRDSATGRRTSVIVKDVDGNWVQFFQRPS